MAKGRLLHPLLFNHIIFSVSKSNKFFKKD